MGIGKLIYIERINKMHKLTTAQLQSTKKRLSQICNFAHKDYVALKPHIAEAWLRAEKGTEAGERYFEELNSLKAERRMLRTTILTLETSIKAVKAEMARKCEINRVKSGHSLKHMII